VMQKKLPSFKKQKTVVHIAFQYMTIHDHDHL